MNNIPSNLSLEEILKYSDIPEELKNVLSDKIQEQLEKLQEEIKELIVCDKKIELLEEQLMFQENFIVQVFTHLRNNSTYKAVCKNIKESFEDCNLEIDIKP